MVRDLLLPELGAGSPDIPFRDGYSGALVIGGALVFVWVVAVAAVNFAVLRWSSVSRRLYWSFMVLVALVSAVVQLLEEFRGIFLLVAGCRSPHRSYFVDLWHGACPLCGDVSDRAPVVVREWRRGSQCFAESGGVREVVTAV